MTVSTIVPAATQAKLAALMEVLGLPDVSGISEIECVEPSNCATLVYSLEQQLHEAVRLFGEVCAPVNEVLRAARGRVLAEIAKSGGKALPHDTFDVRREQDDKPDKKIDVLRQLKGKLPDDLYHEAVYVAVVDVRQADPDVVDAVIAAGGKPVWDANLVKLNKHARDFGGEIAEIIREGSPRVAVGAPRLHIEPRKTALKSVS